MSFCHIAGCYATLFCVLCGWQQKMDEVRQALQQMGGSMSVVVQQIYNVMDLCNDGQLRKLSEQHSRSSRDSAGETVTVPTSNVVSCPSARRSMFGDVN